MTEDRGRKRFASVFGRPSSVDFPQRFQHRLVLFGLANRNTNVLAQTRRTKRANQNAARFKRIVKSVSRRHGMDATFMAKPYRDMAGSGLHANLSLSGGGVNLFPEPLDPLGLSKTAYSFIAGLMAHIPAAWSMQLRQHT